MIPWKFPVRKRINLHKLIPNFDHCKTLYTECDYRREKNVQEQLVKVDAAFKAHQYLVDKELERQYKFADRLWVLSHRYYLLTSSVSCLKPYPEPVSMPTEQRVLCEFFETMRDINMSNCRISDSLDELKVLIITGLQPRCDKLDHTMESIFMVGNASNKSLPYLLELIDDLCDYFNEFLCQLFCWSQLIDPGDQGAIEDYMWLVKPRVEYDHSTLGLPECKCRRTKHPVCKKRKYKFITLKKKFIDITKKYRYTDN